MKTALTRTAVYLQLNDPGQAPLLEELLWTLKGVESVTFRMDGEPHFEGIQVIGNTPDLPRVIEGLLATHGFTGQVSIIETQSVSEEDWAESWKQYWHINRILPHLVIQPSWEPFTPEPGDVVIQLDPGSAFGTGTHETTQLMLYLLQDALGTLPHPPERLLDVGTGSGVLAIAGAKLGIPVCLAIDNDPHAVAVAQQNAKANGVASQVDAQYQPIDSVEPHAWDLVLANILASVLREMMPQLRQMLLPQGLLMMGGITRQQFPEIAQSIAQNGLILKRVFQQGNWLALVCQRNT
jgi:ribosomal protein L11 methyltransferase